MAKGFQRLEEMDEGASILMPMVLLGGEQIGDLTNPETKNHPGFIEVNKEKLVCLAQGGECRHNPDYYSPGLRDAGSWKTPIVDESCPNKCVYKVLVCDNHPKDCKDSVTYYPQYNKFRGQFSRYCRNFDILNEKTAKGKKGSERKIK